MENRTLGSLSESTVRRKLLEKAGWFGPVTFDQSFDAKQIEKARSSFKLLRLAYHLFGLLTTC